MPPALPLPLVQDDTGRGKATGPLLPMLTDDKISPAQRAATFHACMAQVLLDQASRRREQSGSSAVGFTGGVFQKRLLAETAKAMLEQHGFQVHLPERSPVNEAGVWLRGEHG